MVANNPPFDFDAWMAGTGPGDWTPEDEVEMQEDGEILVARGHVVTRMPREAGKAASDADYVQVVADRLNYKGTAHTADYALACTADRAGRRSALCLHG